MQVIRILILIGVTALFGNGAIAKTYETTLEPGAVYNMAAFKLWHNGDVKRIRGILLLNPGSNGDGRSMVDDSYWQDFANKHDLALMGTYFTDHKHVNMMIEDYIKVGEGSGQALINAIDQFATESGHQELSYAPFLLWGHSAGGELNHEIAAWMPERVIYEEVMKARLPDDAMGYKALRPVTEEMGIKGNIITHNIVGKDDKEVKLEETSWLISERLANAWQAFVSKERDR